MCTLLPKAKGKGKTILGISIGTITLGIACLKGMTLEDWEMKTIPGTWSPQKLQTIILFITKYCVRNQVTVLAIKVPTQSSRGLNTLVKRCIRFAEQYGILIYLYTVNELKEYYGKESKRGLMEYVASAYPEMNAVCLKQKKTKNSYYIKLFEAVCTATYCSVKEK